MDPTTTAEGSTTLWATLEDDGVRLDELGMTTNEDMGKATEEEDTSAGTYT